MRNIQDNMKNSLWFTLNASGYCVRYERRYHDSSKIASGYLVEPEHRLGFAELVERLSSESIHGDFYDSKIKLSFDRHGELPVPKDEQEAIHALVIAIGVRASQNAALKKRLEKIVKIAK